MEILPRTDLNFDKLAEQVADVFFENGTSLNEGVIKKAEQLQLNPEQTRRLVEKTNTIATVKLLKTAQDKKAEIKLADFDEIRQVTHPSNAQPTEKTAAATGEIPSSFENYRNAKRFASVSFPGLTKEASGPEPSILSEVFQAEKKIEELTRQKIATEMQVQDSLDFIISEFSKWKSPDFGKFASEAFTLHGDMAAPALTRMAEYLEETVELEKVAYAIEDTDHLLVKMGKVVEGLNSIVSMNHTLSEAKNNLNEVWSKAKGDGHN